LKSLKRKKKVTYLFRFSKEAKKNALIVSLANENKECQSKELQIDTFPSPLFLGNRGKTTVLPVLPGTAPLG
jgi:hypothetical protein